MNDTSTDVLSDTTMTINTTWTSTEQPDEGLSSRDLIILWFVVFTGMIGCLANGSVLIALVADKKLHKYSSTFLVKYQIVLDFVACVLLVVSYAVKVAQDGRADTTRRWGNVVCMLFIGDGLVSVAMYATAANLAMIALERYSKIVHSVKHRIHFKT